MDFYQVLEKRRTIRDFSDKKVTDEVLEKVLLAAFKAPTNDHLRQFEFIVVRGQENIARLISPDVSDMYPISYYKDYIKNSNKFYKNINGVKASLKVKGNKVIYTVDIQYDSDYMKDLVEAGLVSTNGSYKDIDYISLKDTIENQKSAGLTCKEK